LAGDEVVLARKISKPDEARTATEMLRMICPNISHAYCLLQWQVGAAEKTREKSCAE
jgi:hypothetical protein